MIAVDISCGYVDAPVNEGVDMVAEINRMKKEKMLSYWLTTIKRVLYKI